MKFSAIFALASLLVLTPAVLLNSAGTNESEANFPFGLFNTQKKPKLAQADASSAGTNESEANFPFGLFNILKKPKLAQADASSAGTTEGEANFPFIYIKHKLAQVDSSSLAEKPYHS